MTTQQHIDRIASLIERNANIKQGWLEAKMTAARLFDALQSANKTESRNAISFIQMLEAQA